MFHTKICLYCTWVINASLYYLCVSDDGFALLVQRGTHTVYYQIQVLGLVRLTHLFCSSSSQPQMQRVMPGRLAKIDQKGNRFHINRGTLSQGQSYEPRPLFCRYRYCRIVFEFAIKRAQVHFRGTYLLSWIILAKRDPLQRKAQNPIVLADFELHSYKMNNPTSQVTECYRQHLWASAACCEGVAAATYSVSTYCSRKMRRVTYKVRLF